MAHGTSVARPHSSPLMKLARRPKNRPIGTTSATRSDSMKGSTLLRQAKARMATTTPSKPAMERHAAFPQGQDGERVGEVEAGLVEQHVAQPAAQDDAQRRPQQEVVDLLRRQELGRLFADPPHDLPADDQSGDVGQRVPADGERPELDQHRVDLGIGDQEGVHWAKVIARMSGRQNRRGAGLLGPAPLRTSERSVTFSYVFTRGGVGRSFSERPFPGIRLRRPSRESRRSARRRASCRPTRRIERRGRSARFR